MDKVGALMAQKVHDLVFVSAGTPGLDQTLSPSEGLMLMMIIAYLIATEQQHYAALGHTDA